MTILYYSIALALVVAAWFIWREHRLRKALETLKVTPLPTEWTRILQANLPIYRKLPFDLRTKLNGYIQLFLATKSFEPCGNVEEITDKIRLMVAAQACLLLLNDRNGCFDKLNSILIYPNAYRARNSMHDDVEEDDQGSWRLGESWGSGSVILSWHHTLHGGMIADDGTNVVIHEFAHQLDQIDGWADGSPILKDRSRYPQWQAVFTAAYNNHVQRTADGRRTAIDPYGATNPAEFFAVSTETFFEKPKVLHKRYPELYAELVYFYAVDPLSWETT